jgi:hypothetical protein
MKGILGLKNHHDLYKKLEREYERLKADPSDADVAYNFFVTAWHLLEWKHPDPKGKQIRAAIRNATPLLQVCEHLAVGAKHFTNLQAKHASVTDSRASGVWGRGFWAPGFWAKGLWAEWLEMSLSGDAEQAFGKIVKAHEFAAKVIDYWKANL